MGVILILSYSCPPNLCPFLCPAHHQVETVQHQPEEPLLVKEHCQQQHPEEPLLVKERRQQQHPEEPLLVKERRQMPLLC